MKTQESKEIFNQIFELLKSYPRTDFARISMGLFYPTIDRKELERRHAYVKGCADLAKKLEGKRKELGTLLSKITPLIETEPRIDDLIATEDRELYDEMAQRLGKTNSLFLVEGLEDLEYLRDFEFVRYVQRNARFADQAMELSHVEPVYEEDMEFIAPELVISFYGSNRECMLSAVKIALESGEAEMKELAANIAPDLEAVESTGKEGVSVSVSKKLERLSRAVEGLESSVQECLENANTSISGRVSGMSLKGDEVLELLKTAQASTVLGSLPKDFSSLISKTAREHEDLAAERLGIDKTLMRGLYSTDAYPLELDTERIQELKQHLMREMKKEELNAKQLVARRLAKHVPVIKELVRKAMEFDLRLAVGEFCMDHRLKEPGIQEELGTGFKRGRSLFLKGEVQPVDYVIGSCSLFPGRKERAVVITGANSGGKTTLLELTAQVVLMTHMGLYVPADSASSSLFEEVYYFGKGQGDDAGAFETLLKTFESLLKSSKGCRIVLADEIEAITEPGAAAKILAALLDWFKEDRDTVIAVVTHLGEDIKDHVGRGVRIDGIEASGLDESFNLIVDRNPAFGKVAKSTPELILERLSRTSDKKAFYKAILDRFRE